MCRIAPLLRRLGHARPMLLFPTPAMAAFLGLRSLPHHILPSALFRARIGFDIEPDHAVMLLAQVVDRVLEVIRDVGPPVRDARAVVSDGEVLDGPSAAEFAHAEHEFFLFPAEVGGVEAFAGHADEGVFLAVWVSVVGSEGAGVVVDG